MDNKKDEYVDCPICAGSGKGVKLMGVQLSCSVCLGRKIIKNDPWWIAYYKKVFGTPDGVQIELRL
jgi:hypothetical protein